MKLCDYGCGQKANYQFKNGKFCCEKNCKSCPKVREEWVSWNKGKKDIYSKETLKRMSEAQKGIKKKPFSEKHKKKISEAQKGIKKKSGIKFNNTKKLLCDYGCGQIAKYKFKNGKICCTSNCICRALDATKGNVYSKANIFSNPKNNLCDYGCGQIAKYKFKNKICCSEYILQCPNKKNKPNEKTKKKMSITKKLTIKDYQEKHPFFCKIEELKEDPKTGNIQVRCKNHNCKNSKEKDGWFIPTKTQIGERIRQLESENGNGGSYLYCSEYCKNTCDLYRKSANQLIKEDQIKAGYFSYNEKSIPGYEIFRQEVFKRNIEEYGQIQCEYCGNTNKTELAIHHENPIKINPEQSLDPINGWVLCGFGKGNNCHWKIGHRGNCSTNSLAERACENKF